MKRDESGFTLIELMVVMAVIATLLTLAVPRYFASLERSREAVLHHNLTIIRDTLDKYYGDKGKYPDTLDDLVSARYLRGIPKDPLTDSEATWIVVAPDNPTMGGIYDVHSGAPGNARDGAPYQDW